MVKVKVATFLVVLIGMGSSWFSLEGVLNGGSKKRLGNKEIIFLCDIHSQEPEHLERGIQEAEEFIHILKEYSQTTGKPLYILTEEFIDANFSDYNLVLGPLREKLKAEGIDAQKVTAENIELRAASGMAVDIISMAPTHRPSGPSVSVSKTFYADEVRLQDVLDEYDMITVYLREVYISASEAVKEIYDDSMIGIGWYIRNITQTIEESSLSKDEKLESLLEKCSSDEFPMYRQLATWIFRASSSFIDLYILHRVLAVPDEYKVILLAGGKHCNWVSTQTRLFLGAKTECMYGQYGGGGTALSMGEKLVPLLAEDLKSLIYA